MHTRSVRNFQGFCNNEWKGTLHYRLHYPIRFSVSQDINPLLEAPLRGAPRRFHRRRRREVVGIAMRNRVIYESNGVFLIFGAKLFDSFRFTHTGTAVLLDCKDG